jgi:hypothetical protein
MDDIYPGMKSSQEHMTLVQIYMTSSLIIASLIACGMFFVKEKRRLYRFPPGRKNTDDSPIINA